MAHNAFIIKGTKTVCEYWAKVALIPQERGIGKGKLTSIEFELYDIADTYNLNRAEGRHYKFEEGTWKRFPENDAEALIALRRIINTHNY